MLLAEACRHRRDERPGEDIASTGYFRDRDLRRHHPSRLVPVPEGDRGPGPVGYHGQGDVAQADCPGQDGELCGVHEHG